MTQLVGSPAAVAELLLKDPLLIRVLYERRRSAEDEDGLADVFVFEGIWAGTASDAQDRLLYVSTREADIQIGQVDSVDKKHLDGATREEQVASVVNEWRRRHLAEPKHGWDRWLDAVPFVAVVKGPYLDPVVVSADHPLIAAGLATMAERFANQSPQLKVACDVSPEGACEMELDFNRFMHAYSAFQGEQLEKIFSAFLHDQAS